MVPNALIGKIVAKKALEELQFFSGILCEDSDIYEKEH